MPATRLTRRAHDVELISFRPARTAEEVEHDRIQSKLIATSSLAQSHRRIAAWLAAPCEKHHAKSGEKCSPFVGGICRDRIEASRA